jgi:hypothetical protein
MVKLNTEVEFEICADSDDSRTLAEFNTYVPQDGSEKKVEEEVKSGITIENPNWSTQLRLEITKIKNFE